MDVKNKKDYVVFLQDAIDSLKNDSFYNAFQNYLSRGKNSLTIYRKQNQKTLDRTWIDIIEDAIVNFDNIVRNPRKYIAREEEIVPIELSRSITTESVKHLAQHTNMIAEINGDNITPNKILNINKEESFEIYENRFAYTTLLKVKEFVDKRAKLIEDSSGENNIINVNLESMFYYGDKALDFSIKLKSKSSNSDDQMQNEQLAKDIERVKKIQTIINTFCLSKFAQVMSKFALVRPPITRTNVILKNPDFKKVLAVWQFVNTYEKAGYEIHSNESLEDISKQSYDNLADNIFLNYLFYYNMIVLNSPQEKVVRKSKYSPKFVKKFLDTIISSGELENIEFSNVVKLNNNKRPGLTPKQEKAYIAAMDYAFKADDEYLQAKARAIQEAEEQRLAKLEKEKLEREKRRRIEEQRRERIRQREIAKREKEKEKARLAKEAEIARLREIAKKKKIEELRKKLFARALKSNELIKLAQLKARILTNDPNFELKKDADLKALDDPKMRATLIKLIKKAVDIKITEKVSKPKTSANNVNINDLVNSDEVNNFVNESAEDTPVVDKPVEIIEDVIFVDNDESKLDQDEDLSEFEVGEAYENKELDDESNENNTEENDSNENDSIESIEETSEE